MECAQYQEQITRHIDRPLAPDVGEHLRGCSACRTYYEEEVRMLDLHCAALAPFRLHGSLSDKILRRLPEAGELADLPTPGSRLLWWSAGLAAAAAMVIVGLFALSPEQGPLPPENASGKVHNVATPAGTPQDDLQYGEQCIVVADVVAVDDGAAGSALKLNVLIPLRGDNLAVMVRVGESTHTRPTRREKPDGTFEWVEEQVVVPTYEGRTRSLKGATIAFASANAQTTKFQSFKVGEKVVLTFPNLPAAKMENGELFLPAASVARAFLWSATREKEIREEIAKEDEEISWNMYDVIDLVPPLGSADAIMDLVKKEVAPDSWEKPGRSSKAENGVITVRQSRSVHRAIQGFLALKRAEAAPVESAVGGKVVSYSPELDVVVLNVGSDNGVREGVEFTISRDGALVASGNAKKVEKTLTVVELKSRESDPRPGDEARWMQEEVKTFTPKSSAAEAKAAAMVLELSLALQTYYMDWNTYPTGDGTGSKELAELLAKNGPRKASYYLFKSDALDGDGNLRSPVGDGNIFYYRSPGIHNTNTYDLWTKDSNDVEDGINNWERRESQGK